MRTARAASLIILVGIGGGCAIRHHAVPQGFPEQVMTGRRSTETVAIASAQTNTEWVNMGSAGMYGTFYGNLSQWTDAAVALFTKEVTASGVSVSNTASKRLTLTVTGGQLIQGSWGWKCAVTIDVEWADGSKETFVGERGSWKYQHVCDAGLAEAVANVLRHDRVIAYLGY